MLTLVPHTAGERLADARQLLQLVEYGRPAPWLVCALVSVLLGVALMLGGLQCGGLLVGGAMSLALSRYGPRWWPGRR